MNSEPSYNRYDPDQARIDAMMDGSGFSNYVANPVGSSNTESTQPQPATRRVSRRGGRSFPEASDSELDPHWQQGSEKCISDGQREINKRGAAAVRLALAEARQKRMSDQAGSADAGAKLRREAYESWGSLL